MKFIKPLLLVVLISLFVNCRNTAKKERQQAENDSIQTDSRLNQDKTEQGKKKNKSESGSAANATVRNNKGIGPIDSVKLGETIDHKKAEAGEKLFNNNCAYCHRVHESSVGPALGNVLERRSPEFVMNMILNTNEMREKDPIIKSLKGEYETRMVETGVTEKEAREIVEYLRNYQ